MQRSRGTLCTVTSLVRGSRIGPCDVGDSGCFAKVKQPSATQALHESQSTRHQSHPSPCQANSRSHIKERCASLTTSTLPKYLQSWLIFWTIPEAYTHWRKSSEHIPAVADQEEKRSDDWTAMPGYSAFHAPVTNVPVFMIAVHRMRVREDMMTLPR